MCPSPRLAPEDGAVLAHLTRRTPSENLPLLLELARAQAARRTPSDLCDQYARDPFVSPSVLDLRLAQRLDALALEAASEFEGILLSPLAPLGTCSVVSPTTQDRAVATARGTEVVSDPTNVLALESARRLSTSPLSGARDARVRLCTVHQVTRPQRFPPNRGFTQHFRMFALAEAGRALPDHGFEVRAMTEHAAVFVRLFDLAASLGYTFPERRAVLLAAPRARAISDRIRVELGRVLPGVPIEERELASTYYDGVRLLVGARTTGGVDIEVGDVGLFDWMGKLTSNRRHRFVASGIGIQLFPLLFRPPS